MSQSQAISEAVGTGPSREVMINRLIWSYFMMESWVKAAFQHAASMHGDIGTGTVREGLNLLDTDSLRILHDDVEMNGNLVTARPPQMGGLV